VAVEGFGEATEGVGAAAVLAALDARDHGLGGVHPLGKLLLGEAELSTTHDYHAGDLLEGTQPVLGLLVLRAARAPLTEVLADAGSDGADVLGHGSHLATRLAVLRTDRSGCIVACRPGWGPRFRVRPCREVVPPLEGEGDVGRRDLGGSLREDVEQHEQTKKRLQAEVDAFKAEVDAAKARRDAIACNWG